MVLPAFPFPSFVEETFDDIAFYSKKCQFKNCSHIHEKGCAIREAVKQGIIDENRYKNYLAIKKESAYYEMSYLEKRNKDKSFGKVINCNRIFTNLLQ